MAVLDNPAPVNLVRSICLCNIFNFLMSACKACLIPFLTLYLKKLGLSATQTGIVIGAKTFAGLLFAPLWSKCAVKCGHRRLMLMFSLLAMGATYLSITAVPSLDEAAFASVCTKASFNTSTLDKVHLPVSQKPNIDDGISGAIVTSPSMNNDSYVNPTATTDNHTTENGSNPIVGQSVPTTKVPRTTKLVRTTVTSGKDEEDQRVRQLLCEILLAVGIKQSVLDESSEEDMIQEIFSLLNDPDGRYLLREALKNLSPDAIDLLQSLTSRDKRDVDESEQGGSGSVLSRLGNQLWVRLKDFKEEVKNAENKMFIVLIVVLTIGEALSSPIEKIADDGWFEFLETIDDIEKYGMHRIWSSFAYILLPVIVTLAVDNTNCLFGAQIHPFMLHFFMFGGFLALTFIFAFCLPMATSEKYKYASKVMKGMSILCCNFRHLMFVITLFITGAVSSSYYNFMFWMLTDLGSGELTMGMCLSLAALSEIPMLLLNDKIMAKIGNGGIVCVSLIFLSGRCLYYSFLKTPWAVLPIELTHAFTHTALWWGILNSTSFNSSPALSRSIRSILSTVYFGLGFALGSAVSGVVYDMYGMKILMQAGAVIAIGWFPILCLSVRCCKERNEREVKYKRLLTSNDASDTDSVEDDWLDMALKDR